MTKTKKDNDPKNNISVNILNPMESYEESLENIALSQKQLLEVKTSLGRIIDSISENPSLFSRASIYWGKLPLWSKITGGLAVTAPTVAIGILAHIGILLTIAGVTVVAYTASSIILDDHHRYNVNIAQRLKEGIFSLADILHITISALDAIRNRLVKEVEKLTGQNQKLNENIDGLHQNIEVLNEQVGNLVETEKTLRETQEELACTSANLKESLINQAELFKENQIELNMVKQECDQNQKLLAHKIEELNSVKLSMGLEVEKAKKIAGTLQSTIVTLSNTVIEDSNNRDAFKEKLETFLSDSEVSFDQIADRICKAEQELAMVKDELERSNERYQELLTRQEQQIIRLEKLDSGIKNAPPKDTKHLFFKENKNTQEHINKLTIVPIVN